MRVASRSRHIRYGGTRTEDGIAQVTVEDQEAHTSAPLHHVRHHSPTGMEWGFGGSGPADLAHSILADALEVLSVSPVLRTTSKIWNRRRRSIKCECCSESWSAGTCCLLCSEDN